MGQNLGDPSPVMRMIELKYKEMKRSGRIPEISIAPDGEYNPRVLNSPLQKLVTSGEFQPDKS